MAEKWRAFVAVEMPPEIKAALGELQQRLQAAGLKARWVRPENMHLTLKFLGDIDPAAVGEIATALKQAAAVGPFSLPVAAVGVFPDAGRPRVIWVGLDDAGGRLVGLQQSIDAALAGCGFAREQRPFRGHLTLARFRGAVGREPLQQVLQEFGRVEIGRLAVDGLVLFRSILRPAGPLYARLLAQPLNAA